MLFDLIDADNVTNPRLTKDGYLVAEALVARTGIQLYRAGELGLDGDPQRIVRVYRPPEEVFANDAMSSYAYRPVTVDHPDHLVDADNWKQHARGQTGGEVLRDKEFVRVPMVLMDTGAINEWKEGKRELSMGYTMDLDVTAGTTPGGEQYDAVQRKLRMNHLALVTRARGGSQLRLGDDNNEVNDMPEVKLTTVTVDGISVETTDQGAQVIGKLTAALSDAQKSAADAETAHAEALSAKDKELANKDSEIEKLKSSQLSAGDMDRMVQERSDLVTKAKSIADTDYTGKTLADIRKTAVSAKLGADAVADKSDDYIAARFDILSEDASQDPVRRAVTRQTPSGTSAETRDKAHDTLVDHLNNAWKGDNKETH